VDGEDLVLMVLVLQPVEVEYNVLTENVITHQPPMEVLFVLEVHQQLKLVIHTIVQ